MPYALRQCGLVLGIVTLFFVAYITDLSLRLLIKAGNRIGVTNYQVCLRDTLTFKLHIIKMFFANRI